MKGHSVEDSPASNPTNQSVNTYKMCTCVASNVFINSYGELTLLLYGTTPPAYRDTIFTGIVHHATPHSIPSDTPQWRDGCQKSNYGIEVVLLVHCVAIISLHYTSC